MVLKSIFIFGSDGEIIIMKHYRDKTSRTVAELFWSNVMKAAAPSDVLPIIDAGRHFFIHIQRDGLFFLAVVQKETSPFFVIDFLQRVYELFVDYFEKLSPKVLKANFTVVYQLLDEMMDYGIPFTTEPNTLRDIVAAPDMLSAMAGHVLGQSGVASALPQAAAGDVDWRRRNVKYRTNELFVDLIESVHCVMEPSGAMVSSEVTAEFKCDCRLSGMPDLTMYFNRAELMDDVSFHRCVRYKVWEKSKQVSFVPPDGKFTLMTFRSKGQIQLPLLVEPKVTIGNGGGDIRVRVTPRDVATKPCADVLLEIRFPRSVSTATLSADSGRCTFDETTKVCTWDLGTLKPSNTVELSGTIQLPTGQTCDPPVITLGFSQHGWNPSSVKVTSVQVSRETYKPFKGIRYITVGGDITVRTG